MALLFAKPTEYAVRALMHLAARNDVHPITVLEIAQAEGISSHHLAKVMKTLTRSKIVKPVRGPGGGYRLLREVSTVTLWEVMAVFDALRGLEECALGWKECDDEKPCPLHERWTLIREHIVGYLKGTSISDLVEIAARKETKEIPLMLPAEVWVSPPSIPVQEFEGVHSCASLAK